MNCERCQARPAIVHLTEIINNKKRTLHLCEQCAREFQAESFGLIPQMNLHNFLASLFSNQVANPFDHALAQGEKCPNCGLSEAQFAKSGLLGCADCYRKFSDRLDPVFRRIHGISKHTGKVPERTGGKVKITKEIDRLKVRLKDVISREEFEEAARIRDQIRNLEKELSREVE
ncbi:MAG: UvrB/UvrC motif-containing protein [Bacillota bacterium]